MAAGRGTWWWVVGALVAVVIPAAALHSIAAEDRLAAGLTSAPFGWPRLLVAHLTSAVPLALVLAGRINRWRASQRPAPQLREWLAAALVVTGFALVAMSSLANGLDAAKAGFIPRVLFRSAVSTALVTPWAGLAMSLAAPVGCPTRWQIVAALVFAVVPPGAYADRLVETRSAKLATFASTGRFVLARDVLVGLTDVAGDPAAADRRERIEKDIAAATMSVARELPPKASISARLSRAFAFVQLHRLADAEAMVSPLAKSNSTAGLLLAAVYRHQARWTEAERAYRQVLDMLLTQTVRDARSAEDCVAAYDGLADARRGLSRPGDVAQTYCEALERLPGKRGYFHFQIGLHEANQGRSETALGHFAEAVRLDPELERLATPHVRRLRVDTPSCFTSRPWSRQ